MKKKHFIVLLIVLVFVSLSVYVKATTLEKMLRASNAMIKKVSVSQAYQWYLQKKAVFIDVDEPGEYKKLTIPGAINIPRGVIEFKIGRYVGKGTPIVVFSYRGRRGILSAYNLQGLGYTVYNLNGGLVKWKNSRYPVVSKRQQNQANTQIGVNKIIRRRK